MNLAAIIRVNTFAGFGLGEAGPDIRLCRVDIESLARVGFGDPAPDNLRRPARDLSAYPQLTGWLASGELKTVNGFKSLKRQVEWLAGRLAAKHLVIACLDPEFPMKAVTVSHEPGGAPFLVEFPDYCLSITHAGRFAVAAISLDPHLSIGIDIERLPVPATGAFLQLAFTARERIAIDPNDQPFLARAWTLKEAYLKYIRRGFHNSLKRVEFLDGVLLEEGRPVPVHWEVSAPDPDHLLTVLWGPRFSGDSGRV